MTAGERWASEQPPRPARPPLPQLGASGASSLPTSTRERCGSPRRRQPGSQNRPPASLAATAIVRRRPSVPPSGTWMLRSPTRSGGDPTMAGIEPAQPPKQDRARSRPRPEISSRPRARHAHLVSPARSPVPYQPLPTATRVSGPGAAHGLANLSTFLSISALAPPSRPYLQAIVGSDIRNRNPRVGVRVPPPAWLSVLYELLLAAAVVATLSKFGESNGACRRPTSRTPRPGDTRSAHRNVVTGGCSARSPVWRVAGAPRRFGTHLPLRLRATPAGRRQRRCFRSGARA